MFKVEPNKVGLEKVWLNNVCQIRLSYLRMG